MVYSLEDLKKYSRLDLQFQTIPQEVKDVLVHSFKDLDILHFETLQIFSELNLPQGPILFQSVDKNDNIQSLSGPYISHLKMYIQIYHNLQHLNLIFQMIHKHAHP